jgi:uridine kinase
VTHPLQQLEAAIRRWQTDGGLPQVIAIDGHGAAGKTTLATELARRLDAVLLHTDDYFRAANAGEDPRPMSQYYDCAQLRREALEPALKLGPTLIIVEGVSSAAPALADLVTHAVFLSTPEPVRTRRLRSRVAPEEWDENWLAAERVYFASRPPESFDLIVSGATDIAGEP